MIQIHGSSVFWKTILARGCLLFQMIITSPVKGQGEMVQAGNSFLMCFLSLTSPTYGRSKIRVTPKFKHRRDILMMSVIKVCVKQHVYSGKEANR